MLVASSADGFTRVDAAFLIPELGPRPAALVKVNSGKTSEFGLVVYTGAPVHVTDVMGRAASNGLSADDVSGILTQLFEELSALRIGNVVKLEATPDGWHLVKVRERPATKRAPLP